MKDELAGAGRDGGVRDRDATAGGGGWGSRFRVGATGGGAKLGEPLVLEAAIPARHHRAI
nr:hypothetical protein [Rhizobium rhizogenes]